MMAAHTRFGQYGPRYVTVGWRTYESSSPEPFITGNRQYQPVVWISPDGFNWTEQILFGYEGWYGHQLYLVSEKQPAREQGAGGDPDVKAAWGMWAYGVRSPVAIRSPGVLKIWRSVYGDGWLQVDAPGQEVTWESQPWATNLYVDGVRILDYQKLDGRYDVAVGSRGTAAQTFALNKDTDELLLGGSVSSSPEQEMRGIGCCAGGRSGFLGLIAVGWARDTQGSPTVGAIWRRVERPWFWLWPWERLPRDFRPPDSLPPLPPRDWRPPHPWPPGPPPPVR